MHTLFHKSQRAICQSMRSSVLLSLTLVLLGLAPLAQAQSEKAKTQTTVESSDSAKQDVIPLTAKIYLSPDQVSAHQIIEARVEIELAEGYKAYVDQFQLKLLSVDPSDMDVFRLGKITNIQPSFEFEDKFSKRVRTGVKEKATIVAPLEASSMPKVSGTLKFELTYQACTEKFCLFPKTVNLMVDYKAKKEVTEQSAEQKTFSSSILEKGFFWGLLICFLAGIATSLTPCVFPMIPITMAVLGREAHARTTMQNLRTSIVYVLGMCTVYTVLGMIAASTGVLFGSFISHPAVLVTVCIVLLLMALSLFGVFELSLPGNMQDRLSHLFEKHGLWTVFTAGMFSGVMASPCVGPVLVGILTLIAQTQDLWTGFWLMLFYSLGLGMLFIGMGLSSKTLKLLPKSGPWLKAVKIVLAFFLLGSFLYYLNLLKPHVYHVVESDKVELQGWQQFKTAEELKNHLEAAKSKGQPVILDFYADWCAACHQLKKETFSQPDFQKATQDYLLLQYDATNSTEFLDQLRKDYSIVGLPTVVIFNRQGGVEKDRTVTEFISSEEFIKRLQGL